MSAGNGTELSEFGWSISLPEGWYRQEGTGTDLVLTETYPITFASKDYPSCSLTWMAATGDTKPDTVSRFQVMSFMKGPVDPYDATALCNQIFPLLGELSAAEMIRLADNTDAFEVVETYSRGEENRVGYQLIFPLYRGGPGEPFNFQRLCFYCSEEQWEKGSDTVKAIARSFKQEQPFKIPPRRMLEYSPKKK